MNKIGRENRRGIAAGICLFFVLISAALLLPSFVTAENGADGNGAAVVEDLYDVTGETSLVPWNTDGYIGDLSESGDIAFRSDVRITNLQNGNGIMVGILLAAPSGSQDNSGFWFVAKPTEERMYLSSYGTRLTAADEITSASAGAKKTAYDAVMSGEWFELEIGRTPDAAESAAYRVYVKIDGTEVLSVSDTTEPTGSAVWMEMAQRGEMRTTYETEYAAPESVSDLFDVSGESARTQDGEIGSMPAKDNAAFLAQARITDATNRWGLMIGVFASDTSGSSGYWFVARPTEERIYLAGWGRDTVQAEITSAATGEEKNAYDAVMSGEWFALEIGRAAASIAGDPVGWGIYVKINGVTVLRYTDTRAAEEVGTAVCGEMLNRAELRTTYDYDYAAVNAEDLYDVSGKISKAYSDSSQNVGEMAASQNTAFTFRLSADPAVINENSDTYLILGILCTPNAAADTYSTGYWMKIDKSGVHLLEYGIGFYAGPKATLSEGAVYDAVFAGENVLVEFGVRDASIQGKTTGRNIYLKIDGEEVLSWMDTQTRELGRTVITDNCRRAALTSAKVETDEIVTTDFYDLRHQISTLFFGNGWAYYLGNFAGTRNVSMISEVTFDDEVGFDKQSASIYFLKATDGPWDAGRNTGYEFSFDYAWVYLRSMDGRVNAGSGAMPAAHTGLGNTVTLEIGTVDCYVGGEFIGAKVFVNLNGFELISLLDPSPLPYNGSYIMSPYGNSTGQTMEFATTKDTITLSHSSSAIDLPQSYTVLYQPTINLPVKEGKKITEVKINGESAAFELVNGACAVEMPADTPLAEIEVTAEDAWIAFSLQTGEGGTAECNLEQGQVAYNASAKLILRPAAGKVPVVTVNGEVREAERNGDEYVVRVGFMKQDVAITVEFTENV